MDTETQKPIEIKISDEVVDFLVEYGGFQKASSFDYFDQYPNEATWLAKRIQSAILNDKTITPEYAAKVKSYNL